MLEGSLIGAGVVVGAGARLVGRSMAVEKPEGEIEDSEGLREPILVRVGLRSLTRRSSWRRPCWVPLALRGGPRCG